ncbi:hypothetical protein CCH79_00004519 [Gambusia affinis]|uniref:C-type lectin domain-containing protein n=1 Tax=Gambusia affinis TaxID=33528 RepID=A0A315UY11_GAMAF|nr:hypothetical protein CCH79_00004519 [Gambusia affinis]
MEKTQSQGCDSDGFNQLICEEEFDVEDHNSFHMSNQSRQPDSSLQETHLTFKDTETLEKDLVELHKQNKTAVENIYAAQKQLDAGGCTHCPPGWLFINLVCYYFSSDNAGLKSWQEAREFCQIHGGDLPVIDTKDKENPSETINGFWFGLRQLTEEDSWHWLDGTFLVEGYWKVGQPDDYHTNEDCAAVYPNENFFRAWNDLPCGSRQNWICEKAPTYEFLNGTNNQYNTEFALKINTGANAKDLQVPDLAASPLLVEVNFLSNQTEIIRQQKEAQNTLEKERANHGQLKLEVRQKKTLTDSLQRQISILQTEKTNLLSNASALEKNCGRCPSGWLLLKTSCYYFSNYELESRKNWSDSRADCIRQGGDLLIINNLEEQQLISTNFPRVDSSSVWWMNGFWIGLSEVKHLGTWTWTNNVTETSVMYWRSGQPSHTGPQSGNCAAFHYYGDTLRTWYTGNCQQHLLNWICEIRQNNN